MSNSWTWNISIKQGVNIVLEKPFLLLCSPWLNLKGREELVWQLYSRNRHCFKHYAITFLLHFLVWLSCLCYLGICNKIREATSQIFGSQVRREAKNISGLLLEIKALKYANIIRFWWLRLRLNMATKLKEALRLNRLHCSDIVKQRKCHLEPGGAERKCHQDWIFSPTNIWTKWTVPLLDDRSCCLV